MNNYQFDSLKFATEGLTGGGCTIISDVKGLPSFMIPFNKRTNAQLFDGGSEKTHSAFVVDDVEYKRFFFSKFINCIVDGLAYSWPLVDPKASINYDASHAACNAKGTGWHLASIPERAVINHLIYKSGFIPRGFLLMISVPVGTASFISTFWISAVSSTVKETSSAIR